MKIWTGFGSEHSYRLVLVGHFATERDAEIVVEKFERLQEIASDNAGDTDWDEPNPGYTDEMYQQLRAIGAGNLSRPDVDGFSYLYGLEQVGKTITLRTDDAELQGFLKLIFDNSGRVEIYSSHDWTESGEPRNAGENESDESTDGSAPAPGDKDGGDEVVGP